MPNKIDLEALKQLLAKNRAVYFNDFCVKGPDVGTPPGQPKMYAVSRYQKLQAEAYPLVDRACDQLIARVEQLELDLADADRVNELVKARVEKLERENARLRADAPSILARRYLKDNPDRAASYLAEKCEALESATAALTKQHAEDMQTAVEALELYAKCPVCLTFTCEHYKGEFDQARAALEKIRGGE